MKTRNRFLIRTKEAYVFLKFLFLLTSQICGAGNNDLSIETAELPKTQILDIHTVSESPSVREQLKNIVDLTKECCQTMKKGERATLQMTAEQLKLDGYGHCGDFCWVLKNSFNKAGILSQFASVYSSTGIIHALIEAAVYDSTQSKMLRFLCDPYVGNVYAFGFLDIIEDLSLSESYYERISPSPDIEPYMGYKLFKDLSIFSYDFKYLLPDTFIEHEVFTTPNADIGFLKKMDITKTIFDALSEIEIVKKTNPLYLKIRNFNPVSIIIDENIFLLSQYEEDYIPLRTIKNIKKIVLESEDFLFFNLHLQ